MFLNGLIISYMHISLFDVLCIGVNFGSNKFFISLRSCLMLLVGLRSGASGLSDLELDILNLLGDEI